METKKYSTFHLDFSLNNPTRKTNQLPPNFSYAITEYPNIPKHKPQFSQIPFVLPNISNPPHRTPKCSETMTPNSSSPITQNAHPSPPHTPHHTHTHKTKPHLLSPKPKPKPKLKQHNPHQHRPHQRHHRPGPGHLLHRPLAITGQAHFTFLCLSSRRLRGLGRGFSCGLGGRDAAARR